MTYAYRTEFREGARRQLEHDHEEIRFLQAEWKGVEEMVDLILQNIFPSGPTVGASCAWQERLKLVPDRLKMKVKNVATTATIQALAMMKSHYPEADLKRFEEGYTTDMDEANLKPCPWKWSRPPSPSLSSLI